VGPTLAEESDALGYTHDLSRGQVVLMQDQSIAWRGCKALSYNNVEVARGSDEVAHCCADESYCCGVGKTCGQGSDACGFRFLCGLGRGPPSTKHGGKYDGKDYDDYKDKYDEDDDDNDDDDDDDGLPAFAWVGVAAACLAVLVAFITVLCCYRRQQTAHISAATAVVSDNQKHGLEKLEHGKVQAWGAITGDLVSPQAEYSTALEYVADYESKPGTPASYPPAPPGN
jgi:hypothetical protein